MGCKRTGKREFLFFYLACILIGTLVIGGCTLKEKLLVIETEDLLGKSEYSRALEKDQQLLKMYPRMGDKALFQMGLICAHPKNPDKDYRKSLIYFQRLVEEFPKSDLKNQAQTWVLSLQEIIEKEKKIGDLQRQIEKLKMIDLGVHEKKRKSLP